MSIIGIWEKKFMQEFLYSGFRAKKLGGRRLNAIYLKGDKTNFIFNERN